MRLLLLGLILLQSSPFEDGLRAYREGRYEEAARLLSHVEGEEATYEVWLDLGLAEGHLQHLPESRRALDRAIALAPERPEAWTERGGLSFLETHYEEAIRDLKKSLSIREDAYTRDLLASALYLSGQDDQALAEWNRLGKPKIRTLTISGLRYAKDKVAREEIHMEEGELLDVRALKEARLRLKEVGIFDRVTLRPIPQGDGTADLEVALVERHGFGSLAGIAVGAGVDAIFSRRVDLGYADLGGEGASASALYRFQSTRPLLALTLDWPRPLGAPFYLELRSYLGKQDYALPDGAFQTKGGGGDLKARLVVGPGGVLELGISDIHRTFSVPRADGAPGTIVGIKAGLEQTLVSTARQRWSVEGRVFETASALGSDLRYTKAIGATRYRAILGPPEGVAIEKWVLAAQFQAGWSTSGAPIDQRFAPGGSPDMELPLRAHPQDQGGVLGATPIGRSLVIGNTEARVRIIRTTFVSLGGVVFYDAARIGNATGGASPIFHDVGVGLRLAPLAGPMVRADYGRGLTDGSHAFFVGLGQVF